VNYRKNQQINRLEIPGYSALP